MSRQPDQHVSDRRSDWPRPDALGLPPDAFETPASRRDDPATRLRKRHSSALRALYRRPRTIVTLIDLSAHVAIAVGAAVAALAAFRFHAALGAAATFVAWWIVGSRLRALGNMLHEASHGTLTRSKWTNNLLGHALATVDFTTLAAYRTEHLTHHAHLGDPKRDLDFETRHVFGFADAERPFVRHHLLRPLSLRHLRVYLRPSLWARGDHWATVVARIAWLGAIVAACRILGIVEVLVFAVIPYCTTYQILRYWSDAFDHAGIIGAPTEYERSRNHTVRWRLLEEALFPRSDAFHLVHHLFPAVPTRHQRAVHALLLAAEPTYRARTHAAEALLGWSAEPTPAVAPSTPPPPDDRATGVAARTPDDASAPSGAVPVSAVPMGAGVARIDSILPAALVEANAASPDLDR